MKTNTKKILTLKIIRYSETMITIVCHLLLGKHKLVIFPVLFFLNNNNNIPCIVELLKINLKLWEKTMFQCV